MAEQTYELTAREQMAFKAANLYVARCENDPRVFTFVEGARWADTHREEELHHFLDAVEQYLKERALMLKKEYRHEEAEDLLRRLLDICGKKNWSNA